MEWHEVRDPATPLLDELAARYKLHPLHIEDCRHRGQSAKVEEQGHYLFIVLKPVEMNEDGSLEVVDLDLFIGPDFLITVEESECATARKMLEQVRTAAGTAPLHAVFYRIFDGTVDSYLPILDRFSDIIDELEDRVLERPDPHTLERIFETKRALIELRRVLANTRDVAGHLQRMGNKLLPPELMPYLRDVYDHLARNLDSVEMHRDLLTGSLDIYLSSVANRTNQVMKVLTVLGTIALPSIVVSGFFGMNTKDLWFAQSPHATVIAVAAMSGCTLLLLALLRYFDWL
jgi:magnesium transporter